MKNFKTGALAALLTFGLSAVGYFAWKHRPSGSNVKDPVNRTTTDTEDEDTEVFLTIEEHEKNNKEENQEEDKTSQTVLPNQEPLFTVENS